MVRGPSGLGVICGRVPWKMRTLMFVFLVLYLLLDILVGRYLIVIFNDF